MGKRRSTWEQVKGWFLEHLALMTVFLLSCALWVVHDYQSHRKPDLQKILQAVVSIERKNGHVAGTGFFYNREGCILTANHVIEPFLKAKAEIFIREKGRLSRFIATPATNSEHLDLAVLCSTSVLYTTKYLRVIHTQGVRRGDKVYVIGHPDGRTWNMTNGIVSKKGYRAYMINATQWVVRYTIFTDAVIWHGNSGGPVLDEYGNVIGIITNFDTLGPFKHPAGINMAVTGTDIKRLLETI